MGLLAGQVAQAMRMTTFDTGTCGTSELHFALIMSNVTDLRIRVEWISGNEAEGLDNVILVPEPAGLSLIGLGAAALRCRRHPA